MACRRLLLAVHCPCKGCNIRIAQFGVPRGAQQQIGRLDVTVHCIVVVQVLEAEGERRAEGEGYQKG